MANSSDTVATLATELARVLEPLEDQLAAENVLNLLAELGIQFPPELLAQAAFTASLSHCQTGVAALPALVVQLSNAVEADNVPQELTAAGNLTAAIAQIADAIDVVATALGNAAPVLPGLTPGDVTAFAGQLAESLLQYLLVTYLEDYYPRLTEFLAFLGVLEKTVENAGSTDPLHPPFFRRRVKLNQLSHLLSAFNDFLRSEYGWGDGGFDGELLLSRIRDLLYALTIPAQFQPATATRPLTLRVLLFSLRPKLDIAPPGIELFQELSLADGFSVGFPFFFKGWSVEVAGKGAIQAGLSLLIQPPSQLTVKPPTGSFTGEFWLRLIGRAADSSHPFVILGQAGGSRLQATSVSGALGSTFTNGHGELAFEGKIENGKIVLSLQGADGFLSSILPPDGFQFDFSFTVGWSGSRGIYFSGGAGLETAFPLHLSIGPVSLDTLYLKLVASGDGLELETTISASAQLGPVSAAIDRVGFKAELKFSRGNLGPADLRFGFRPPTGLGIAIDAGPVTGGGFISFDEPNGRYTGILQLRLMEIGVTAIGLLDTRLPGGQSGYSFLIIIAVNLPPIQLGFGFTLTGIGGLAGINRTVVTDAIVQGLRNGVLDHIMFPPDPIRNAPQIISDLRTVFPPAADRYVFGPMLQLAWGTPSLIIGQLGVILEVPDPVRLILIGQLKMELPTPEAALVEIHVDLLGVVDFGQKLLMIVASLHDSRVTVYSIYGDMALRLFWGDPPNFALSMGGWNPHFTPPPGMPELRRLTIALGTGDNPRFTCQSYFAVTSNSFQFGALTELYAEAAGFNIHGWIGFDALVIFSPFSFIVDISAGVELRAGSSVIAGIHLSGHLAGPNPWHVWGEACLSLFFFDICVGFNVTIGDKKPEDLPTADPWPLLQAAIQKPESWTAVLPVAGARPVSLAVPQGSVPPLLVDPLGGISLHQKVLPLNRKITRFGEAKPTGPDHYNVSGVNVGSAPAPSWTAAKDYFAAGQFQDLSDADKLSRPSFELMDAGVSVASDAAAHGGSIGIDVEYETIIVDAPDVIRIVGVYKLGLDTQMRMTSRSAAATSPSWKVGLGGYKVAPGVTKPFKNAEPTYVVASTLDMSARADIGGGATMGEAHDALDAYLEANPGERGTLHVVPAHELEVVA